MTGVVGELFDVSSDAALLLEGGEVTVLNASAVRMFGPTVSADVLDVLVGVPLGADPRRVPLPSGAVVDVTRRLVGGREAFLLRDVSRDERNAVGLRRLAAVSRGLLGVAPVQNEVLQALVTEAKALTGAAYSALLLLREGSLTETSHFVYDAPRHLFPDRMPRVVGLLAVPVAVRGAARLDDIRGHPAGRGLPGVHPPIGPLLAVPVLAGDRVLGELAVANPPGGRLFDAVDEGLLSDLAAHVAVAAAWAAQAEVAREQEVVRQEVVDTARHDIRTPLGAGKGYAQLLARRMDQMTPEQVAAALDGLVQAFQRIESFTDRLLVDSRHALIGVDPVRGPVDLAEVLGSVERDAEVSTGRPGAVEVRVDPTCPTVLNADPEMVREVIDNLVSNALKHTPGEDAVVVSVRAEGPQVRVDVRDTGPGIGPAEQATLFERWSRTDSSRARNVPGHGLGLSIVKRLVTAHGGLLGVSSRPGEGSTFWVTFPLEPPG